MMAAAAILFLPNSDLSPHDCCPTQKTMHVSNFMWISRLLAELWIFSIFEFGREIHDPVHFLAILGFDPRTSPAVIQNPKRRFLGRKHVV
jgi:hypothetical protein